MPNTTEPVNLHLPWRREAQPGEEQKAALDWRPDNVVILGDNPRSWLDFNIAGVSQRSATAIADLFLAAPEMLAVLIAWRRFMDDNLDTPQRLTPTDLCQRIDAIIAQADRSGAIQAWPVNQAEDKHGI